MLGLSLIKKFIQSIIGKFIIGGLTVSGIAYFSNNISNPAIAGIIGAVPVGMPSSVFVDDSKVEKYALNLLLMSIPLFISTFTNWVFIAKFKFTKYQSVLYSLFIFVSLAVSIAFLKK